jgi:hypothetical protein
MARRFVILLALAGLGVLFAASSAGAAPITLTKWESLTCNENEDLPLTLGVPEPGYESTLTPAPGQCTEATPEKLFTQAAAHPDFGITDFRIATYPPPPYTEVGGFPTSFTKDIVVDTPEGLSVNPEAAPQCTVEELKTASCEPDTIVGVNYLTVAAQSPDETTGKCEPPKGHDGECLQARVAVPVYNMEPFEGVPSMVAFLTESGATFIVGSLSPVDQHVTFTISDIDPPSETSPPIIESRLVFNGQAGNGTYLTMPSNCTPQGQISTIHVDSQGSPYEAEQTKDSAEYETPTGAEGCENVPFEPSLGVSAPNGSVDSPDPATVNINIPFEPSEEISNSYLKTAKVTLPEGMAINPSVANGLEVCSDEQFHYHTNDPVECPGGSKIGTVEIQTPSLPANSINGDVYAAAPLSSDPSSGEEFRIFIYAFSQRYGVNVRLEGKVFPNLETGRLTTVVAENPQATFSSFRLHFNGLDKKVLTLPPTCGRNTATSALTPWSEQPDATPSTELALNSYPGGGSCPKSLGERPFTPV